MNHASEHESPIDAQLAAPPATSTADQNSRCPNQPKSQLQTFRESGFVQSRAAVLAVLFLVTGFLGLPLLWMNEKFSDAERIFWAIVNSIYTLILIAAVAWVVWWAYSRVIGF